MNFFYHNKLLIISLLFFIPITVYSLEGASMSLLYKPKEEIVVSSPMEGHITFKGKPAIGAKVERKLIWKDQEGETDFVITDDNGWFSFPIVKDVVKLSKISEFVMYQDLNVYFNGQKYEIWGMGKNSKVEYGELGGKPVNFRCELTDEIDYRIELDPIEPSETGRDYEIDRGLLGTSCKWDSIETKGK